MQIEKYPRTNKLLNAYLHMKFGKADVACPYWVNRTLKNGELLKGPFSGKGTPKQIMSTAVKKARILDFQIRNANDAEVTSFLKAEMLGIDCSGLVFHLTNTMDKEKGGNGIADEVVKESRLPHWRKAWRANANHLTNDENTKEISLKDVQVGDLIRLSGGHHVVMIIDREANCITYVHSSKLLTKITGVHLGRIKINDWSKGLETQEWEETNRKGVNLVSHFTPAVGDSIRRFRWWK